jgi:PAS domain S-box-containing protein
MDTNQISVETVRIRLTRDMPGKPYQLVTTRETEAGGRPVEPVSDIQQLFHALYDAALITTLHGTVVDANVRAVRFLDYDYRQLCGMSFVEVVPGTDDTLLATIRDNLNRGCHTLLDAHCLRRDGSQFPAEIAVTKLDLAGTPSLCFFIRDVTRRKQAEEENQRLEAQFRQAQKLESLGLLAGGIAHDFNNLLMAILGNSDLALNAVPGTSPARNHILEIERASRRAAELCRQLLAYSGRSQFTIEPINLSEAMAEMSQMLEVSISKKATLSCQFTADLPRVEADVAQVRQVIMNLITNASDSLGERSGTIRLATGVQPCDRALLQGCYLGEALPEGPYVYMEVADTGCGMDPETKARIFDPFFTTKSTGRGLGLAAVLGIVRGHQGCIEVQSSPGYGSLFRVFLPVRTSAAAPARSAADTPAAWRGSGTVLVVDDEETVRVVTRQMLQRAGFSVLTASDGREALTLYAQHRDEIVCVMLDLTMPLMDGEETLRELRRIDPSVRVLMSSGYSEQEIDQRFAGQGVAGFISKPYSSTELVAKFRQALGGAG